ncbi:MAG TPA: type II toxin-antitoxin system mRNA interferase toxin, RelE/StbE family, partial [Clostridia bacterium]|nr:type II toxin-antitoxin system mRNA interferase toxin, RelE/StbE family [Clostridia bacterium]
IKKAKIELGEAIRCMQAGHPLPDKFVDHPLKGYKGNVRDCHILNDLVLIYEIVEKDGEEYIDLLTIKNHSQTFG